MIETIAPAEVVTSFTYRKIGRKMLVEIRPAAGGYGSILVAGHHDAIDAADLIGEALVDGYTLAEAIELAK